MSKSLEKLCNVEIDHRDDEWERDFFQALVEGKIGVLDAEPQEGPDGWPYMLVETGSQSNEPALNLMGWLTEKGIGLVVNPQKGVPDYIFSYGMLWNYRETARFFINVPSLSEGQVEFNEGQSIFSGPPTVEYLPLYVRSILKTFFGDQGISRPRFLVVSKDEKHWDLCFSLESLGNPKKEDHAEIAESIAWFLPTHYGLLLVSEKGMPKFFDL